MLTNAERYQLKLRIATELDEHRQGDGISTHSVAEEWWCCVEAVATIAEEFYDGRVEVDYDAAWSPGSTPVNLDDWGFENLVDKLQHHAPVIQYRPGGRNPLATPDDQMDTIEETEGLVDAHGDPLETEREAC